jgi:23S rRNA (cytosine1962-C5)-methyltransferase
MLGSIARPARRRKRPRTARYDRRALAELDTLLRMAAERRAGLVARLSAVGDDCWRAFHGSAEGRPGLTLDRYGPLLLAQTFRAPLDAGDLALLEDHAREAGLAFAWNHRGAESHPGRAPGEGFQGELVCQENQTKFALRARHRGRDPWLFLDLRAARARLAREARGRSFLNLYCYTAAATAVAARHGARACLSVDFAASALEVGARHLELNGLDPASGGFLREDCIPAARQLAGLAVKGRSAARPHARLAPRRFDLVLLDPPAKSVSPFGAVDVERDHPALLKPALLCLEPGGLLLATNHVASVSRGAFAAVVARTAEKCGVELAALEVEGPGEDFPASPGESEPAFKLAVARRAGSSAAG